MKKYLLITGLLLLAFTANILWGSSALTPSEVWQTLMGQSTDPIVGEIVFHYRLPKALAALICGSALGMSGLLMQTLFRNPLAGPDVLGVSAGATLGVALLTMGGVGTYMGMTVGAPMFAAIIGALLVMLLILWIAARVPQVTTLLIVGLMMGYFVGSAVSILQSTANPDTLKLFTTWTFGSLSSISEEQLLALALLYVPCFIPILLFCNRMDVLQLGDEQAALLGVPVRKTRTWMIVIASVLTGAVTATAGPIAFVGVTMPHIARSLTHSPSHRTLLPMTCLLGSLLLLVCNLLAELPDRPLPLNAVTACFGAPLLVYIILRRD
jgi:iron complex transport system permease protein